MIWIEAGAVIASYLAGSIPTGLLVSRARGIDIRQVGSKNIGATNVARALGRKLGALVLLLDALKGFIPAALAERLLRLDHTAVAAVGLAAIVGHVFPVWLRFRGGKGVATGLGVFSALVPVAAMSAVMVYLGVVLTTRISSLGSLAAAAAMLAAMLIMHEPAPMVVLGAAVFALIVWRHRDNIRRLLRREESKL